MQTTGDVRRRPDIDPAMAEYLKSIPEDRELSFAVIREHIENGSGGFTEAEGILLLLESIVRRFKGDSEW